LYLVDTSVWIGFFRASPTAAVERLKALLSIGVETGTCTAVLQEILQGTSDQRRFNQYRSYFETQPIHLPKDPIRSAIAAAQMYFDCRRQGISVRSSNDCLIAQTALEHGLILLHDDEDFRRIGRVVAELREVSS